MAAGATGHPGGPFPGGMAAAAPFSAFWALISYEERGVRMAVVGSREGDRQQKLLSSEHNPSPRQPRPGGLRERHAPAQSRGSRPVLMPWRRMYGITCGLTNRHL